MQLRWKVAPQQRYMRYWNEQRHLDYWMFFVLLVVALALLYALVALLESGDLWPSSFKTVKSAPGQPVSYFQGGYVIQEPAGTGEAGVTLVANASAADLIFQHGWIRLA
jgi:hypothetical protein